MTYNNTLKVFSKFGVNKIEDPVGREVDLDYHEIVFSTPHQDKAEEEVIHVVKDGYMLGDRVIRAAKVGVIKNS